MKLNVTQKILVGYVVGLILSLAFTSLTLLNGKKIEATTIALSQEKIPGLIAVASLKSNVQAQSNHLYALYATNDQNKFFKQQKTAIDTMRQDVANVRALTEYKPYEQKLAQMGEKQEQLTKQFVQIMQQPEVDWDAAREALAAFSKSADEMSGELDALVNTVSTNTLSSANTSQSLTQQLINVGFILAALTFLGALAMAYYSHRQVAVPLREISEVLGGIASRKDLAQRIQQPSEDEIGAIAHATNNLLEEFQKLARTLDGTAQEVSRTSKSLIEVTESARQNMLERNTKLRTATHIFMTDIEASAKANQGSKVVDIELHSAQLKFIQMHLSEIDEGKLANDKNISSLQAMTAKLQKLAENMHSQIRLLNF